MTHDQQHCDAKKKCDNFTGHLDSFIFGPIVKIIPHRVYNSTYLCHNRCVNLNGAIRMIMDVLEMGEPLLNSPAEPIEDFNTPLLKELINELRETQHKHSGVGVAAPQIGVSKRVIIVGFTKKNERYPNQKPVPEAVLINPEYEPLSNTTRDDWEACLSIPGLRGLVPRYNKIKYTAFNLNGEKIKGVADGFHARIIQHECDHINGFLYPQRIKDLRNFGFEKVLWEKVIKTC